MQSLGQSGDLPQTQKSALVFPRLSKPTLDAEDANSHRPISNLSFASQFVERVVATRFIAHAERHKLFSSNQSAYRRHHNAETAVVCVMNVTTRAMDRGEVTALVLLDLGAAFDTVDQCTLIDGLHRRFAVEGKPLLWFNSSVNTPIAIFSADGVQSKLISVDCSVARGSVIEQLELISYTEDVVDVFTSNLVRHHLFANDRQFYRKVRYLKLIQSVINCAAA